MPPLELSFENQEFVEEGCLEDTGANRRIPIATSAGSLFTIDGYPADPPLNGPRVITAFTADALNQIPIPINVSPEDFYITTRHIFTAGQPKPPSKRKK